MKTRTPVAATPRAHTITRGAPPAALIPAHHDANPTQQAAERDGAFGHDFSRIPASREPSRAGPRIQTKLSVSAPGDDEEKQADAIADEVIQAVEPLTFAAPAGEPVPESPRVSDTNGADIARAATGAAPSGTSHLESLLTSRVGLGSPLPPSTKSEMETALGADLTRVRVHSDRHAADMSRELNAQAFTYGRDVFFAGGRFDPASRQGKHLLAHELAHVLQQGRHGIRRKETSPPKKVQVTFFVVFHQPVNGAEFFTRCVMQYAQISRADAEQQIKAGKFNCRHPLYTNTTGVTPDLVGKSIEVAVEVGGMTKSQLAESNKRAASVAALPPADRDAINNEADRRFWSRVGGTSQKPLTQDPKHEGMRQMWVRMRDSVVQDQEGVAKVATHVQKFLNPGGERIPPRDYKTFLRLAKKLETFTEADWALYKRRVTSSTSDYERLEESIDLFKSSQAVVKKDMDRIRGRETLFQQIKAFRDLQTRMFTPGTKSETLPYDRPGAAEKYEFEKANVEAALQAAGFATLAEFDAACAALVETVRSRAVEIAMLALGESERVVVSERQRYEDPNENAKLFAALQPTRAALDQAAEAFSEALPTPAQLKAESTSTTSKQKEAEERYGESSRRAEAGRAGLSDQYPILKDPELRSQALNVASADALGVVLRRNADERRRHIQQTRVNVLGKRDRVFEFKPVLALAYQELGIASDSVFDLAVREYKEHLAAADFAVNLAIGALAIGLGLLTFGGGTIAVVAISGGLILGIHQAAEEWEKYSAGRAAAHTSFDKALSLSSEEPSALWLALSLIAVGLDGAALAGAFKAALPAAKALKAGSVANFQAELAKATELSGALKKSLERAGVAQKEYEIAIEEMAAASRQSRRRLHSGPDPDFINAAAKAAVAAVKRQITEFEVFLRELKISQAKKGVDIAGYDADQYAALVKAFEAAKAGGAAKLTVQVPYKAGAKTLTFDESGRMVLDGKLVGKNKFAEVYKNADVSHVVKGHGPDKPLIEVMNEANAVSTPQTKHAGKSGRFATDRDMFQAIENAKAHFKATGETKFTLDALPNQGRAFSRADLVPPGVQPFLPFDALPGIVEVPVTHFEVILDQLGQVTTIYPKGF